MAPAGANQLSEQDTIEAIDFGYEAVTELIKSQEDLLKDLGIKQNKPSDPEEDKALPSYLEKNCNFSLDKRAMLYLLQGQMVYSVLFLNLLVNLLEI